MKYPEIRSCPTSSGRFSACDNSAGNEGLICINDARVERFFHPLIYSITKRLAIQHFMQMYRSLALAELLRSKMIPSFPEKAFLYSKRLSDVRTERGNYAFGSVHIY